MTEQIWLIILVAVTAYMLYPAVRMWGRKREAIDLYKICRVKQIASKHSIDLDAEFMKLELQSNKSSEYHKTFEGKLETQLIKELELDEPVSRNKRITDY